jgi:SAM-dependent methyltransferase
MSTTRAAPATPATYSYEVRNTCPACDCPESEILFEEPFGEGNVFDFILRYYGGRISREKLGSGTYRIARCTGCGLLYQAEVLDEQSLTEFYEMGVSADESLAKREAAAPSYFAAIVNSAAKPLRLTPKPVARDVRVLDFGMGWGHWAIAANALGCSVWGAELSDERRRFAESHGVVVVDPFTGEFDGHFDFINTDQVFEHLTHPLQIGEQLVGLLRPGGVLKIFVPDADSTLRQIRAGKWRPSKDALHPLEHVNGFNRRSLERFAGRFGLAPVGVGEVFDGLRRLKYTVARDRLGASWYFRKPASS